MYVMYGLLAIYCQCTVAEFGVLVGKSVEPHPIRVTDFMVAILIFAVVAICSFNGM